jgi:hypothetical protein
MSFGGFYFSDDDLDQVERDRQDIRNRRRNTPRNRPAGEDWSSDVYVALPPCGECIPARVGNVAGHKDCCIFRLVPANMPNDGEMAIIPVLAHASDPNSILRRTVQNIWDFDICYEEHGYIRVHREKNGVWLADPAEFLVGSPTTTAEPNSGGNFGSSNLSAPVVASCEGQCKWTWDNEAKEWNLTENGCTPVTTTEAPTTTTAEPTTTSDDGDVTTTTLGPCDLCPAYDVTTEEPTTTSDDGSTTTTGEPTTTTTLEPCQCVPPDYCGSQDCEITFTPCANSDLDLEPLDCTDSTTTSADCSTTCPPDPDCSVGCDWVAHPYAGWILTNNGCSSRCPCSAPTESPNECKSAHTPCEKEPCPPDPPGPDCRGGCEWVCWNGAWFPVKYQCHCINCNQPAIRRNPCRGNCNEPAGTAKYGCDCAPPTNTPCTDCDTYHSKCNLITPPTTPAPDPCGPTTTTGEPTCNSGECTFYCEDGEWTLIDGNCPDDCPCESAAPIRDCEECETTKTNCGGTTTTSEPTTTTGPCAPCPPQDPGNCLWQWLEGAWVLIDADCEFGFECNEVGFDGEECECVQTPCNIGDPTTEEPTTTTGGDPTTTSDDGSTTTTGDGGTTTTGGDPTTTSDDGSTTTAAPCPNADPCNCMFQYLNGAWWYDNSDCEAGEPCGLGYGCFTEPVGGAAHGDCIQVPCSENQGPTTSP